MKEARYKRFNILFHLHKISRKTYRDRKQFSGCQKLGGR